MAAWLEAFHSELGGGHRSHRGIGVRNEPRGRDGAFAGAWQDDEGTAMVQDVGFCIPGDSKRAFHAAFVCSWRACMILCILYYFVALHTWQFSFLAFWGLANSQEFIKLHGNWLDLGDTSVWSWAVARPCHHAQVVVVKDDPVGSTGCSIWMFASDAVACGVLLFLPGLANVRPRWWSVSKLQDPKLGRFFS